MAENIIINFDVNSQELTNAIVLLEKMGLVTKKDADEFVKLNNATNQSKTSQDRLQSELKETEKSLSNVASQSQKATTDINNIGKSPVGSAIPKVNKDLGGLSNTLAGIGGAIASAFAVTQIVAFGIESVKAFQEAEKNALILKSAVGVNGGLQSDFEDLINQSKELQKVTIFSDDAVQQAQTAALQFGLTKDQIKELIPVVTDFASATGQSLQSALDGVLQGVNGLGRGLKIYGVTIDENATATERLANISDQLTKKFHDQAEAIGNTAAGAAEKYSNQVDELQEKLGEKLSPKVQATREFFLELAGGAVFLAEKISQLNSAVGNTILGFVGLGEDEAEEAAKRMKLLADAAIKENQELVTEFKKSFRTLTDKELFNQIGLISGQLKANRDQAKELSAEEGVSLNKLAIEYKAQITALSQLLDERKKGIDSADEQTKALERLRGASKLSNEELLVIKKTLESFNDKNLEDEIKLIDKIIEARKKSGDKAIADREKSNQELLILEQKLAEDRLKVLASTAGKEEEIELEKQTKIKELLNKFAQEKGVDVSDINQQFNFTGNIDLSQVEETFRKFKIPEDVITRFNSDVQIIVETFAPLINAARKAQDVLSLEEAAKQVKINVDNIKQDYEDLQNVLNSIQSQKELEIKLKFVQTGDFSKEAFDRLQSDIEAESEKTYQVLLEQAEKFGIDKEVIDQFIIEHDTEKADGLIENSKRVAEEEEENARKIRDAAIEVFNALGELANTYYDGQLQRLDENTEKILESYDKQAEANEDLHARNIRGDRLYETEKKKIEALRKQAEEKADKEKRKILRDQAILNKALGITNAIINTAVAVTANLEIPILAALIAIAGAVEIATILAQPIPALAKGTERVTGKGTETSDEVPARLSVGERVVKASTNRKYFPILSAIHHERFDSETLNRIVKIRPEVLDSLLSIGLTGFDLRDTKAEKVNTIEKIKVLESALEREAVDRFHRQVDGKDVSREKETTINNQIKELRTELTRIEKTLTKEVTTEMKVFNTQILSKAVMMETIKTFRSDLAPIIQQRYNERVFGVIRSDQSGLDEYGVARALNKTELGLKHETIKEIAKEVSREKNDPYKLFR